MRKLLHRLAVGLPLAAGLSAILVACGGGGGGDIAGVGTGGTGTISSTVSVGSISGFGSIIVSGVRFDDTTATVTDEEGAVRSRNDLKLGMVTTISGTADFVARTGVATAIRFGSDVLGPITSVDLANSRLVVLGATISVKNTTVFADGLGGLAALQPGDLVEVYGFYSAASRSYTATRIERKTGATRYSLRGPIESLDSTNQRFTLAGVLVSYAGVPAASRPGLANDLIVRASASTGPSGGLWRVESLGDAPRSTLADGEAKIEGEIGTMLSATRFVVDGVTVDAASATLNGTPAVGRRVEAEGRARGGVLIAKEVEVSDDNATDNEALEITALITDFDPLTLRFRLRGQLVDASLPGVLYEGGTAANLANDRKIELKGYFDAVSGAVMARKIHFED